MNFQLLKTQVFCLNISLTSKKKKSFKIYQISDLNFYFIVVLLQKYCCFPNYKFVSKSKVWIAPKNKSLATGRAEFHIWNGPINIIVLFGFLRDSSIERSHLTVCDFSYWSDWNKCRFSLGTRRRRVIFSQNENSCPKIKLNFF